EVAGVPVRSWNDGEAVAAAEAAFADRIRTRPLLALKMGTSMASGLATGDSVIALPMQLAKFSLCVRPRIAYTHPITGMRGTARDLIGAEAIEKTFKHAMNDKSLTYRDYCEAVVRGNAVARELAIGAIEAIAEIAEAIASMWSSGIDLVVTGTNIQDAKYRR